MSTHITGPHDAKRHTTLYRTYSINTHQWSFRKTGTSGFGNAGEPSGNRCLGPTTGGGGEGLALVPPHTAFGHAACGTGWLLTAAVVQRYHPLKKFVIV